MKKILLVVFLFLVLFYVPFINKAVHIDDGNFIEMSKAIDFPFSVKTGYLYYFMGNKAENWDPFNSSHPPFIPIYLKITSFITGYKDYLMHICFLVFPILLLLSTFLLAKELNVEPIPALMIICGNAVLLPVSHNLMADAPMLSLWILAAYFLISGVRKNLPGRTAFSFLTLVFAGLISYQTFFLLPAFFIYLVIKRSVSRKIILMFFLPVAVISLTLVSIALNHHSPVSGLIGEVKRGLQPDRLFNKALSIPIIIGISTVFLLPLKYKQIAASKRYIFLAAVSILIVIAPVMSLSYPVWSTLWLIFLAASGIFFIIYVTIMALAEIEDRALGLFLLAWVAAVIFYNIFLMPFGAVRYLMPVIVPLSFIFLKSAARGRSVRLVRTQADSPRRATEGIIISAVLTSLLGLAVAYGDYIYASSYRDFAGEVKNTVGEAHDRVWYTGEWGMHYYMDKNGFRYLTSDSDEPKQGDLIIVADVPKLWGPSIKLYSRMELLDI
ncbi:MAG: glycosyltransferase family 39 protein, partial [Thermodesulfovibrionales bacterium]|nr:glycosyltransferase family 39 protein [Thermodesulfovibrionales bacterium]